MGRRRDLGRGAVTNRTKSGGDHPVWVRAIRQSRAGSIWGGGPVPQSVRATGRTISRGRSGKGGRCWQRRPLYPSDEIADRESGNTLMPPDLVPGEMPLLDRQPGPEDVLAGFVLVDARSEGEPEGGTPAVATPTAATRQSWPTTGAA
jgi:hypothetical protein